MWADNETERDFLNFSGIADTVAEIIAQARGRPVSIGVFGVMGCGQVFAYQVDSSFSIFAPETRSG
ncbi:hypothetical protein [Solilutibacter oculi]|uniref:hypothetical protein n=1 Tax=Solilutibacter oculi TaxID=2698682 RepID=UPI001F3D686D|nr:hypothetical protein [Lysobacter oculi]